MPGPPPSCPTTAGWRARAARKPRAGRQACRQFKLRDSMAESKVALVVGAGEATGGAIARRFAREGYAPCVTRRTGDKLAPPVAQIEAAGGPARALRRAPRGPGRGPA